MKKFRFIFWRYKLNKKLDFEYECLMSRIGFLEDSFVKYFFEQLIICCKDDISELYTNIGFSITKKLLNNIISTSLAPKKVNMNVIISERFLRKIFMQYCFYCSICFMKSRKGIVDENYMIKVLFYIFGCNENEKSNYFYFSNILFEKESIFEFEFIKQTLDDIFLDEGNNPVLLAYVSNFFYNSYKGFMKSFTKYIPLSVILERA